MVTLTILLAVLPSANASPTLIDPIDDITFDEDMPALNELNLNNHFSNGESELTFSYVSFDNKIDVRIKEDQSVDFSSPNNWYGAEEITFIASHGIQKVSDTILVTIEPVNDAPLLLSPLKDPESFDEDHMLLGALNLYQHFQDIDSELTFSYSSDNIIVKINNDGTVDLSAPLNWWGTEEVVFFASDGELDVSDSILVTVKSVNDVPKNVVNLKAISLSEKSQSNTLELDLLFTDVEDDILSFQISGNSQIKAEIDPENSQLRLQAPEDWSGKELITITASDSQGASQSTQFVVISSKSSNYSSGPIFYFAGLVLAIGIAGVRLQAAGRKRHFKSPVKLESYRHFKGQ
jgi:hypothetical protein